MYSTFPAVRWQERTGSHGDLRQAHTGVEGCHYLEFRKSETEGQHGGDFYMSFRLRRSKKDTFDKPKNIKKKIVI